MPCGVAGIPVAEPSSAPRRAHGPKLGELGPRGQVFTCAGTMAYSMSSGFALAPLLPGAERQAWLSLHQQEHPSLGNFSHLGRNHVCSHRVGVKPPGSAAGERIVALAILLAVGHDARP